MFPEKTKILVYKDGIFSFLNVEYLAKPGEKHNLVSFNPNKKLEDNLNPVEITHVYNKLETIILEGVISNSLSLIKVEAAKNKSKVLRVSTMDKNNLFFSSLAGLPSNIDLFLWNPNNIKELSSYSTFKIRSVYSGETRTNYFKTKTVIPNVIIYPGIVLHFSSN